MRRLYRTASAAIVVALSACSAVIASRSVPSTYKAPTVRTFPAARTGELIKCSFFGMSARVRIPPPGEAAGHNADGRAASVAVELTRANDGSLIVSCQP